MFFASIFFFARLSLSIPAASAVLKSDDRVDSGLGKDFSITASDGTKIMCEFTFSFTAAVIKNWFSQVLVIHRGSFEADAHYNGIHTSVLFS